MIAYIVTEGDFESELLKKVLPENLKKDIEIVPAGGVSATKSLARSLIVRRQVPVAVVIDSDSLVPDLVQERRSDIQEILESVAVNTPVKVILAVPQIETIFFHDSVLLFRILGYSPSQEALNELLTLAASQPRQTLELLLTYSRTQMLEKLTEEDIKLLRKTPVIQEIICFIQSVQETVSGRTVV